MQDRLTEMLEPVVEGLGYDLLLLDVIRGQGITLRLYIDKPEGVGIEDCEIVSRQVSAVLEVEDPISSNYNLEVSSPGWDRPLRKPEHFQAYIGWEAKIMLGAPLNGRRKFRGIIESVSADEVAVQVDGETFVLPLADMERARLVFDQEKYQESESAVESDSDSDLTAPNA